MSIRFLKVYSIKVLVNEHDHVQKEQIIAMISDESGRVDPGAGP